jgi:hypothetical protein
MNKSEVSTAIIAPEEEPVKLQIPLNGKYAKYFNALKSQTEATTNTELARSILHPTLSLIDQIGWQRFMVLVNNHAETQAANRSRA